MINNIFKDKWTLVKNMFTSANDFDVIISEYQKRSLEEDKFFLLNSKKASEIFSSKKITKEVKKDFFEMYREWDDYGSVSLYLGQWLDDMINDPSIRVAIHRTSGYGIIDNNNPQNDPFLEQVFNNGLKNYGHLFSSGVVESKRQIQPNETISMLNDILTAIILLKTSYKNSNGAILMTFPSRMIDKNGNIIKGFEEDIYYINNNTLCIKPDYLLGYISNQKGVCQFYPNCMFLHKNQKK